MTTTTYYDLNIVEGTDIVNPLTVDNPNYEKIDETMHNNAVSGVTLATEIANATVHALNRENSECAVIRFIATSNWKTGDTMTVDGVQVTTLLPSGEILPDGAYVINANVLCILTGTNLTVYADRKKIDNASEIRYNGTTVADAINKINDNLTECSKFLGYAANVSLENAIAAHITKLIPFGEGIIHGTNISGTLLPNTNDVIIKVIRITGSDSTVYNWYRVVLYDCQSAAIYTIINVAGIWSTWQTMTGQINI